MADPWLWILVAFLILEALLIGVLAYRQRGAVPTIDDCGDDPYGCCGGGAQEEWR